MIKEECGKMAVAYVDYKETIVKELEDKI